MYLFLCSERWLRFSQSRLVWLRHLARRKATGTLGMGLTGRWGGGQLQQDKQVCGSVQVPGPPGPPRRTARDLDV